MKRILITLACFSFLLPNLSLASPTIFPYLLYRHSLFNGEYAKAQKYLEKTLAGDPGDPALLKRASILSAELGDLEKAKKYAESLLKNQAESWEAHFFLGKVYATMGDRPAALKEFEIATKLAPNEEEIVFFLSQELAFQKNFKRSIQVLEKFQRTNPKNTSVLFFKANVYLRLMNAPFEAIHTYREVLKIQPDNLQALAMISDIYIAHDQNEKGLKELLRMEKVSGEDMALKLKIALLHYEMKNYDAAIEKFKKVREQSTDLNKLNYYLGAIYRNIHKNEKAIEEFSKVTSNSVYYKDAIVYSAVLLEKLKKTGEAYAVIKEGISKRPDLEDFHQYLSELYREEGRFKEAIEVLKIGIKKSTKTVELYYALGMLYEREGEKKKAISTVKKLLKLDPDHAHALNFLGYTYAEQGSHLKEAEALIRKSLELKPNNGYMFDSLGWVYFQQGKMDEAFFFLTKADKLVPDEPAVLEHLADYYLSQFQRSKALEFYRRSVLAYSKVEPKDEARIQFLQTKIADLEPKFLGLRALLKLGVSKGIGRSKSEGVLVLEYPNKLRLDVLDDLGTIQEQIILGGKEKIDFFDLSIDPNLLVPFLMGSTPENIYGADLKIKEKKNKLHSAVLSHKGKLLYKLEIRKWQEIDGNPVPRKIRIELAEPRRILNVEYKEVKLQKTVDKTTVFKENAKN
jgi:tetratricopeptide (TPR) repeat protein